MTVPSYKLENKETTKFLVKATENYCIINFYLIIYYPTTKLGPLSRQQSLLQDANHCAFLNFNQKVTGNFIERLGTKPGQVPSGV